MESRTSALVVLTSERAIEKAVYAEHRCVVGYLREGILGWGNGLCRAGEADGGTVGPCLYRQPGSHCGSWSGLSGEAELREEPSGTLCMMKMRSSWDTGEC